MDASTFAELAAHHGLELPPHDQVADLYSYDSLADFLVIYSLVCRSIRTEADFWRATYECLARCADIGLDFNEIGFPSATMWTPTGRPPSAACTGPRTPGRSARPTT